MNLRLFWSAILFVGISSSAHAGFIEVCKDASPAGSLTGIFSFTVAGQPGVFQAPVGACSPAFQLPNGSAVITEVPQAGSTFFSVSTFPTNRLISFDPTMQNATVQIVAGDISTQTLVDFVNTPIRGPGPSVPEPGTGWLFGLGFTVCAVRVYSAKRSPLRGCDGQPPLVQG